MDNCGASIEFEGVESISTFKTLAETLENLDIIKEISPDSDENWPKSQFRLTIRLRLSFGIGKKNKSIQPI